MPEAKVFEKVRVVTKQFCCFFCVWEWRERVGLVMILVKLQDNSFYGRGAEWTHHVADEEYRDLELPGCEWGKSFNGPGRPSK